MNDIQHNQKRLRWKCRRGILELDIFLNKVLDTDYPQFSEAQREAFDEFLTTNDQLMIDWVLKKKQPEDTDFLYFLSLSD
ncbi:MAG: succinate dehydrogenase assembly factor 2 [Coxiellaceae bacterium]|nr:succinate dehydrogenase assembly factor 2 [Coxiellaceae bacterium]